MPQSNRILIEGTERSIWPGARPVAEQLDGVIWCTAWLRPRRSAELDVGKAQMLGATLPAKRAYADRATLARETGADPADVDLLRRYCATHGIDVVGEHWRSVVMSAPIHTFLEAFGATAGIYELADKRRFRHRSGSLHAPAEIAALFEVPSAFINGRVRTPSVRCTATPSTVARRSDDRCALPVSGRGRVGRRRSACFRCAARSMRTTLRSACRRKAYRRRRPIVKRVDNAELTHIIETAKDIESAIDTQVIGSLAPGAQIVVYATPDDERGVLDGIRSALFDDEHRPSVLSISFGVSGAALWTPVALTILDELFTVAALLGVTIFCASGDHGAQVDDQGGRTCWRRHRVRSRMHAAARGFHQAPTRRAEIGWESSGGGFSARFAVPAWQSVAAQAASAYHVAPGRGVPDVAAQVWPGYAVFVDGSQLALGGTSAVAPAWAALTARLNQRLGTPIGFFAPVLYGASSSRHFPSPYSRAETIATSARRVGIRARASAFRSAMRSKARYAGRAPRTSSGDALERVVFEDASCALLYFSTAIVRRCRVASGQRGDFRVELVDRASVRAESGGGFSLYCRTWSSYIAAAQASASFFVRRAPRLHSAFRFARKSASRKASALDARGRGARYTGAPRHSRC